jgi:hypothetical protein
MENEADGLVKSSEWINAVVNAGHIADHGVAPWCTLHVACSACFDHPKVVSVHPFG